MILFVRVCCGVVVSLPSSLPTICQRLRRTSTKSYVDGFGRPTKFFDDLLPKMGTETAALGMARDIAGFRFSESRILPTDSTLSRLAYAHSMSSDKPSTFATRQHSSSFGSPFCPRTSFFSNQKPGTVHPDNNLHRGTYPTTTQPPRDPTQ